MKAPMFEFTFKTEANAREAWKALDAIGRSRNGQRTVATRDGCKVTVLPEWRSERLMFELESLSQAF